MRDSRDVDSEAMSVIGNYKGSSTKQKTVTGQLREIIFLNHGEQLVNFFPTSTRSTPSSLSNYEMIKFLKDCLPESWAAAFQLFRLGQQPLQKTPCHFCSFSKSLKDILPLCSVGSTIYYLVLCSSWSLNNFYFADSLALKLMCGWLNEIT